MVSRKPNTELKKQNGLQWRGGGLNHVSFIIGFRKKIYISTGQQSYIALRPLGMDAVCKSGLKNLLARLKLQI